MLGLSPLPRTLPAAIRDVRDKKLLVRVSALRDLARLAREGDRDQVVPVLLAVLAEDSAPGVRADAAIALADAEAREGLAELLTAARTDEALRVRQMAILALGELASEDDQAACAFLERSLEATEPELRFQALIAVATIAGQRALDAVVRGVADEHPHVRYVALRLGEEHWAMTDSGARLPEVLGDAARAALKDEAPEVRLAAAILLAHAKDTSGADVLAAAVNDGEGTKEPEDEQAAIDLAGELGLTSARPGLERRAFGSFGLPSDRFAWQARVALARLGDDRAKRLILRGLTAWTRDARTMAVAAAGRAALTEARESISAMRGRPDRAEPDAVEEALQLLGES